MPDKPTDGSEYHGVEVEPWVKYEVIVPISFKTQMIQMFDEKVGPKLGYPPMTGQQKHVQRYRLFKALVHILDTVPDSLLERFLAVGK